MKGPDRKGWYLGVARLEAICGNMASIHSVKSAVNCWCKFARAMGIANEGAELPPTPDGLLGWSRVFAVKGTYNIYLSMLALACQIAGVNATAFEHPCLKKAKRTIGSLETVPRTKRAIQLTLLEQLTPRCSLEGDVLSQALCLTSCMFLLRAPSEALPLMIGSPMDKHRALDAGAQSVLIAKPDNLEVGEAKQNKPRGSSMTRSCWCNQSAPTCPVHVLGRLVRGLPRNVQVYKNISADDVRITLRDRMKRLGQSKLSEFNTSTDGAPSLCVLTCIDG